jgi:chorismate-pyruvate lyase
MAATSTNQDLKLLYPMDRFYEQAGLDLPPVMQIPGEEMPEPYRQLLVHQKDMTPTLEAYHGDPIHLRVRKWRLDENQAYWREVVLTLNGKGLPVEFGAIVIYTQHFPAPAREAILEGYRPLGTLLREYQVEHRSRPRAFIRVEADAEIRKALGMSEPRSLYGRRNVMMGAGGTVLADILEILPPLEA